MKTKSLMDLRHEAGSAAFKRGHRLRWTMYHGEQQSVWAGYCSRCEAWANVLLCPPPNETHIIGPAVAMNCPWGEKK
jgi:hypothetical protein